ncbi:MAG: 30S ribosomal protein S20 [Alphaproteobacteria bacterium]|nr:30S ribosomal protein S20 [Alphaproteobacteria bacterium]
MANHKSSIKRARQTPKRNAKNRARRTHVRALAKETENLIGKKDVVGAKKALVVAESALAKAAGRKTLHWKTAARKTSRLAKRVKAIALKTNKK